LGVTEEKSGRNALCACERSESNTLYAQLRRFWQIFLGVEPKIDFRVFILSC